MHKLLSLGSIFALSLFASISHGESFRCEGFAGVDEYRSFVDLSAGTADFFDNDMTSDMLLVETKFLESLPPQTLFIFEGPDLGSSQGSKLRLMFTLPAQSAVLFSVDALGNSTEMGTVVCETF